MSLNTGMVVKNASLALWTELNFAFLFAQRQRKVGLWSSGRACVQENLKDTLVVEPLMMISESSEPLSPSCLKAFEPKTEVLYYRDFSPCSIHQSTLKALRSIKWTNYGVSLKSITDDETALLEWEYFPANTHIDVALHCYNNQYTPAIRTKYICT